VLWFRRDLRLHDHPALAAAAADGPVLAVFVLDDAQRPDTGWVAASAGLREEGRRRGP
jgi:deoxyribodipyrimidine photo-lyase